MDILKIRQVIEISRCGSFTRAAKELGISQPALSRSIARLEDTLGSSLFERNGEGAKPTPLAKYITSRGDLAIRSFAALEREAKMLAKGASGRLVLGVGPALGELILAELCARMLHSFPSLSLRTVTNYGQDLIRMLKEGKVDLVLAASGDRSNNDSEQVNGIRSVTLLKTTVAFYVRPDHPLALARRVLDPVELLAYPLAGSGLTRQQRDEFPPNLTKSQRHNLNAIMVYESSVKKHLLLHSDVVVYTMEPIYREAVAKGEIARLSVNYQGTHYCEAFTGLESRHSPLVTRCVEIAQEIIADRECPSGGHATVVDTQKEKAASES